MRALAASTAALVAAVALGALGAVAPRVAHATPSLDACTGVLHRVAGTPDTILVDTPGTWCLDEDLVESVDAVDTYFVMISVFADDVTIDCRGHRLQYTGTAVVMNGIDTFGPRQRVTVRNCHLYGFSNAISTGNAEYFLIEDNSVHASRAESIGISTSISARGNNGIIRRNRIHDAVTRAITAMGDSQVLDNLVDGVSRSAQQDYAYAIEIDSTAGAQVRGNTVRGLSSTSPSQMIAMILHADSLDSRSVVTGNVLVHDGSMGPIGLLCSTSARVSDNVIAGFFAPTVGCDDTGDNDFSP